MMQEDEALNNEAITDAINLITEKVSHVMLQEFLDLPEDLKLNIVLIKSAQLLLANVLCQVTQNMSELSKIMETQGVEMKELTLNCAYSGYADKFAVEKH